MPDRSRPKVMGQVLGIVYRVISLHLIKKAGFTRNTAGTGAVTLIQRFGSALNLNIHFPMLFLEGVYVGDVNRSATHFRWVKAPTRDELTQLAHTMARCIGHFLEQQQLLERDIENSYLAADTLDEDPMDTLLGHSITYRIAVGPPVCSADAILSPRSTQRAVTTQGTARIRLACRPGGSKK